MEGRRQTNRGLKEKARHATGKAGELWRSSKRYFHVTIPSYTFTPQAWMNQCTFAHDCSDCRKICSRDYAVGQNLYTFWTSELNENSIVSNARKKSLNKRKRNNDPLKIFFSSALTFSKLISDVDRGNTVLVR